MTWICWRGIELSARIQQFLLAAEILILAAFAIVAVAKVYANGPSGSLHIRADWFNPFAIGFGPMLDGLLLGIFIYWGWDSGVSVNEETEDSHEAPGKAAVMSTLILVFIYLIVSAAAIAFAGPGYLTQHPDDVLSVLGTKVFGSPWDKLLIVAVLTSASASTQTTILPTARTTFSMARWGAIPKIFGRVHPIYLTPDVSTIAMGVLSVVFTLFLVGFNQSQDVLNDSITAVGFAILFYYGFTGLISRRLLPARADEERPRLRARGSTAAYRRGDHVRDLRQGVHRLQQAQRGVRSSALRHPGADRDRGRGTDPRCSSDGNLRGQVPFVLLAQAGDRARRVARDAAARMNPTVVPGLEPPWWIEDALAAEGGRDDAPALRGQLETDVVVVGGGYTGLWTALALRERDPSVRVAVLEAEYCGAGPSGRNGGFVEGTGRRSQSCARSSATRPPSASRPRARRSVRRFAPSARTCGCARAGC